MHLDDEEEKLRVVHSQISSINPIIPIVSKGVTRREEEEEQKV
jgi:hypothetical protein